MHPGVENSFCYCIFGASSKTLAITCMAPSPLQFLKYKQSPSRKEKANHAAPGMCCVGDGHGAKHHRRHGSDCGHSRLSGHRSRSARGHNCHSSHGGHSHHGTGIAGGGHLCSGWDGGRHLQGGGGGDGGSGASPSCASDGVHRGDPMPPPSVRPRRQCFGRDAIFALQTSSFADIIFHDRCVLSYALSSLFNERRCALKTFKPKIPNSIGTVRSKFWQTF